MPWWWKALFGSELHLFTPSLICLTPREWRCSVILITFPLVFFPQSALPLCRDFSATVTSSLSSSFRHSVVVVFFFRVKMCTRPAENHPKKTLQRFCCGQESWRRPKLKAKRCFLQQKVNGMELFIYDKHIDLLNVFIVAISWNLLNDPLFPKPCWAKLQFLLF